MSKKQDDSHIEESIRAEWNTYPLHQREVMAMHEALVRIQELRKQQKDLDNRYTSERAKLSGRIGYLYESLRKMNRERAKP